MEVVTVKLLVAGPFAAGKTTLISAISEIPVVATEAEVSDKTRATKLNTTVSMDYGKLTVADDDLHAELLMFGTPGQERFSFMWDVLSEGMDGYVLLTDLSRPETFAEARSILDHFRAMSDVPFVVAANRSSSHPEPLSALADALGLDQDGVVVPCEAVDRESAKEVVATMLLEVLSREEVMVE
jgi:small GTP-binding protein